MLAVDLGCLPAFMQSRVTLRAAIANFSELKARPGSNLFSALTASLEDLVSLPGVVTGAAIVQKSNYQGPYLRESEGKPRNETWFRHYILRHALEVAFDDVRFSPMDHLDLNLDRDTWMNAERLDNLKEYLNGRWNESGPFHIPTVRHVTAVDSRLSEGVQAADHLSRLTAAMLAQRLTPDALAAASGLLTSATVFTSRNVAIPPALAATYARTAKPGQS